MNGEHRLVSQRMLDVLVLVQVAANIVILCIVVALLVWTQQRQADFNQPQLDAIRHQNEVQICAQHDITESLVKIGRSLGLPVQDIELPDTQGLACP